jgi:hypothetical protein
MKTLQTQYNLIKEGKGDKAYFMKLARYNFPDLVTPVLSYNDTITVLKNKSILSEGIGGVVTKGKTPDWHAIFKENIEKLQEGDIKQAVEFYNKNQHMGIKAVAEKFGVTEADLMKALGQTPGSLFEAKEAKAEEKETTKEVTDMATRGYDYKDYKNIDNIFGETFLKGFYTEMQDPKNEDKTVEELKQIVAKNLAKDCLHYTKEGQFGLKGVGYTTEAPGLGEPKPITGPHKASGYGDLKESVLRSQIYLLVKEVLAEANEAKFKVGDIVIYNGDEYEITRFFKDQIYIKSLTYGGRSDTWVKAEDLKKINKPLTPEDEPAFMQAVNFAEDLYDKVGNVEDVLANLPSQFVRYEDDLKQHLTQKFEG